MLFRGTIKLAHQCQIIERDLTAETIARHWGARLRAYWIAADHVAWNKERGKSDSAIFVYQPEGAYTLATFRTRDELAAWCRAYGAKTDRIPTEGAFTVVLPSNADEMTPLTDDGVPYPHRYVPPTPDQVVRTRVTRALTDRGFERTHTPSPRALEYGRTPGFLVSGGVDAATISQHPFPADEATLVSWTWALRARAGMHWSIRKGPNRTLVVTPGRYGWLGVNEFLGQLEALTEPEQPAAPAYEYFGRHRDGRTIRHVISQAELTDTIRWYVAKGARVHRAPGGTYAVDYDSGRTGFYPLDAAPHATCAKCQRFEREHYSWYDCPGSFGPA